jgi:TMEM175 potassium channel family protein
MLPEHKRTLEVSESDSENKLQGHISEFSNGVFAFAITLLILDIRLPAGISKANLASALIALWPNYMAFLISFFVIGLYWSTYIRLLREIVRTDRTLIWLNLLFLLFIVIIPFSTSVISLYLTRLTVIIYAALMACAGYMHSLLRIYAGYNHRLISKKYSSWHIKRGIILSFIAPICFTASIGIAFFNSLVAQLFWILIFVMHVILGHTPRFKDT